MARDWKLGKDLSTEDGILDSITFDDVILAVHCNAREITPDAVRREYNDIFQTRLEDARFLLENNISEIMAKAKEGRGK